MFVSLLVMRVLRWSIFDGGGVMATQKFLYYEHAIRDGEILVNYPSGAKVRVTGLTINGQSVWNGESPVPDGYRHMVHYLRFMRDYRRKKR